MNSLAIFMIAVSVNFAFGDHVIERSHLVTMRKVELMKIVECISECKRFSFLLLFFNYWVPLFHMNYARQPLFAPVILCTHFRTVNNLK